MITLKTKLCPVCQITYIVLTAYTGSDPKMCTDCSTKENKANEKTYDEDIPNERTEKIPTTTTTEATEESKPQE